MKTIYTDKLGIYPWAMLFSASVMFWSAYRGFLESDGNQFGAGIGAGGLFLILAVRRFWDVREAKRAGHDASVPRIKESDS